MKHFCKEQPNENSLIVGNKFNPISHRPCVHFGTKLKVLNACFEEKSNSLHQLIIFNFSLKKQSKSNSLLSSYSIECIFLFIWIRYSIIEYIFLLKEIRYLITTQSILTLIVLTGSKSFATTFNRNLTRSLDSVLCIILC